MTSSDVWSNRPDLPLAFGVEIGGRGLRVVLASGKQIVDSVRGIESDTTVTSVVDSACNLIDQLLSRRNIPSEHVAGIGIAFGGPVDSRRGVTIRSHRVEGFEQFPLVGVLEERFGIRCVMENDARAAALGEYTLGAGRGARSMVFIHLGNGVGGGIILNGTLQHGASMTAGEIGHMVVSTDGPRCSCGKPGHLEAYASEPAIIDRMRSRVLQQGSRAAAFWLASPGITVKRVFDAYDTDECARAIVDETVQVIGLAGANLVTALNPDAFVLGGYVTEAGLSLASAVRAKIRQYAFDAAAHRVSVARAQLGADGAVLGAVVLAHTE